MINKVYELIVTTNKVTMVKKDGQSSEIEFTEGAVGSSILAFDLREDNKKVTVDLAETEFELHLKGSASDSVVQTIDSTAFTTSADSNIVTCAISEEILNQADTYIAHLEMKDKNTNAVQIFPNFSLKVVDTFCR